MYFKARPASERAHPIVQRLFNEAIDRGLLDKQIAAAAGFSESTLRKWRYGKNTPDIRSVQALAQALGYDIELVRK